MMNRIRNSGPALNSALDSANQGLPELGNKFGSLVFIAINMLSSGFFWSWAMSSKAQPEYTWMAKLLGILLALGFYAAISKFWEMVLDENEVIEDWLWLAFAIVLNLIDSFVAGCSIFILFGVTSILDPGLQGFKDAFSQLPIVGWLGFTALFLVSFFAEWWRQSTLRAEGKWRPSRSTSVQRPSAPVNRPVQQTTLRATPTVPAALEQHRVTPPSTQASMPLRPIAPPHGTLPPLRPAPRPSSSTDHGQEQ